MQFTEGELVCSHFVCQLAKGAVLLQQMLILDAMNELGLPDFQLMLRFKLVHIEIRPRDLGLKAATTLPPIADMIRCFISSGIT